MDLVVVAVGYFAPPVGIAVRRGAVGVEVFAVGQRLQLSSGDGDGRLAGTDGTVALHGDGVFGLRDKSSDMEGIAGGVYQAVEAVVVGYP